MVSADGREDFASQKNLGDHAIERLIDEAAEVGAQGMLPHGIGNHVVGSSGVANVLQAGPHAAFGVGGMVTGMGKQAEGPATHVPQQ